MAFSGSRLAAGRLAAGLTQDRLAQVLQTEQTRISEWERGVMTPRPNLMPRLAAAIGLDALEFLAADPAAPTLEDMRLAAGMTMRDLVAQLGISLKRYRQSRSARRVAIHRRRSLRTLRESSLCQW